MSDEHYEEYEQEFEYEHPEVALIAKILHTGKMDAVVDKQITHRFFVGSYQRIFNVITNHQLKYGKVPSLDTIATRFPDVFEKNPEMGEYEPPEPIEFYCDEVRERRKDKALSKGLLESAELMRNEDSKEAYKALQKTLMEIENDIVLSERQEVGKDTNKRRERYEERKMTGGLSGIMSGIPSLDRITRGFHNGELSAIMGYTGTGKTWALLIIAVFMARQGYRVLVLTTEMSVDKMMDRIDAIGAGIGYSRFMSGTLALEEEQRYNSFLEEREDDPDFNLIVEQATAGVTQISAKIEQHKPEIAFIDGAYLLENDSANERSSGDDWSTVLKVYRDLHKLCLAKDIPICTTTQSKEREISIGGASFARAIANELDLFIGLEQDDEMKFDKEMRWKLLKLRDGDITTRGILTQWDWSEMQYGEIYAETSSGDEDPGDRVGKGFDRKKKTA